MSNNMQNIKKEVLDIKGQSYPMTFPGESDIKKIKAEKGISDLKTSDLPKETIGNVILNSLANYAVGSKKEVFIVQKLAQWVLNYSETSEPLSKESVSFLVDEVLPQATYRTDENEKGSKQNKGVYPAFVMAQVYDELNINKE